MKAVYRNRLLKLAEFLWKLPRKRFDYGQWVGSDWEGDEKLSCGTVACALGWATTISSLRRAGLRMMSGPEPGWLNPKTGRKHQNYERVAKEVFGLNSYNAQYLFTPSNFFVNETPKQVARKIRKFVKDAEEQGWDENE